MEIMYIQNNLKKETDYLHNDLTLDHAKYKK